MRASRAARAALLVTATAGALLASAPAASADEICPSTTVGDVSAGVCADAAVTPTENTGYTVEGYADPYCEFRFMTDSCAYYPPGVTLGATGADVNDDPPSPLDGDSSFNGMVSAPAGTWATVYVDGTAYDVDTPAYCVSLTVRCP